jgi:hypothetical protein
MIARLFNTVRYLKPVQVYGRVCRRSPSRLVPGITLQTRPRTGKWEIAIQRELFSDRAKPVSLPEPGTKN